MKFKVNGHEVFASTGGRPFDKKKPGEVLKLAVKRMLPSGALGKKQLTKLKIYSGEEHPHSAQNPKIIEISKLNQKNIVRN